MVLFKPPKPAGLNRDSSQSSGSTEIAPCAMEDLTDPFSGHKRMEKMGKMMMNLDFRAVPFSDTPI